MDSKMLAPGSCDPGLPAENNYLAQGSIYRISPGGYMSISVFGKSLVRRIEILWIRVHYLVGSAVIDIIITSSNSENLS